MCARKPGDSVPVNLMPASEILLLSQTHTGPKFPLANAPPVARRECGWGNVDDGAKISFYHGENTLGAKEGRGIFSRGDCGTTNKRRFESPENSPRLPGGSERQIGSIYFT